MAQKSFRDERQKRLGCFVTVRIARSKTNRAGVQMTVTEPLDITSMGIDAYSR